MTKTAILLLLVVLARPFEVQAQKRLRFGDTDIVRVDFRVKLQTDLRGFSPHITTEEEAFDPNRARVGIEGRFLKHFQYEAEYEFRETLGGREIRHPLRDAFINFDYFDDFQLQVGKFKLPFSIEQNTGSTNLDFVLRSRLADQLSPARGVGAMLHGRFFNRGIGYEVGVFEHDGENAAPAVEALRGDMTGTARVTGMPLRLFRVPRAVREFEAGFGVTVNDIPEGLSSLRGQSYADETFFPRVFANGRRLRTGIDLHWQNAPVALNAEYARVTEAREGQSVRGTDLPDLIGSGWYIAGTWFVIEDKVQFAGRYDELGFGSAGPSTSAASRSPRSPNVLANTDKAWTLGVNWYPNPYMKIQVNGIRESFDDAQRTPLDGTTRFWMGIVRFQFVL